MLAWAAGRDLAVAVVGLGSNLLAADAGFDGLVVRLAGDLARIERDGDRVVCGGGAALAAVVRADTGAGRWPGSSSAARSRARSGVRCA